MAWITGEDTPIDYPVMHTDNNEYYLSHLYSGEENRYGALFVDCRNTRLFTDPNTLIYGHNMKNDAMFGSLMGYKEQAYYEEHPTMTLYTPDGDYTIELLSGTLENGDGNLCGSALSQRRTSPDISRAFRAVPPSAAMGLPCRVTGW